MRIIRKIGQTVVKTANEARQVVPYKSNDAKDIGGYVKADPESLIAQWISAIDKVISKPKKAEKAKGTADQNELRKQQLKFRTDLGNACWELLKSFISANLGARTLDNWKSHWDWKIHPLGNDEKKFDNSHLKEAKDIYGRWRVSFLSDEELKSPDFNNLAKALESHLHTQEIRKFKGIERAYRPHKRNTLEQRSLIDNRTSSIAKNTLASHMKKELQTDALNKLAQEVATENWTKEDEAEFTKHGDVAECILIVAAEKEAAWARIYPEDAASIISKHYGQCFPSQTRIEIPKERKGLLALHDAVRTYYRKFLRNTKKGGKNQQKISSALPANNQALFKRLRARDTNAITNDLIRLGRVLHYQSTPEDQDGFPNQHEILPEAQVLSSRYWTTDGQSDIKRTEAFVRIWRHVMSLAARTLRTIAEPEDNSKDVLEEPMSKQLAKSDTVQNKMKTQLPLLFGSSSTLFNEVPIDTLIFASLRLVANRRNKIFHFNTRRAFVNNLVASFNNVAPEMIVALEKSEKISDEGKKNKAAFLAATKQLIETDQINRARQIYATCESAHMHQFLSNIQLQDFVDFVKKKNAATSDDLITLPKYNKLLTLISQTKHRYKSELFEFPEPGKEGNLKTKWKLAKFIGFQMIYEKPFRAWLQNKGAREVSKIIAEVAELTTNAAKTLHNRDPNKELISAKAAEFPPKEGEKFNAYFERLSGIMTGEARIQNGYEPDRQKAREAAEWLNKHRMGIVALAFKKFLESGLAEPIKPILALNERSTFNESATALTAPKKQSDAVTLKDQWLQLLYFILHFVPVDDVAQLKHQFDRWSVAEQAGGAPVDQNIISIREVFELYIDMHDAKHTGEGTDTQALRPFKDLFEKPELFEQVFVTLNSTPERLASTLRGLREIMRFGHLPPLTAAFSKRVTASEVSTLEDYERKGDAGEDSKIALAQSARIKLHSEIDQMKSPKKPFNPSDKKAKKEYDLAIMAYNKKLRPKIAGYIRHLETIKNHSELANKVKLNNHIRLHRLMMSVASRLVDFVGHWERDGYFVARALDWLQKNEKTKFVNLKQGRVKDNLSADESVFLHKFYNSDGATTRNHIAHFNFLSGMDVDLTQAINCVRDIMGYDRKMKNAVSKAIIGLLEEEGLTLQWEMKDHQLTKPKINSRTLHHLAKKVSKKSDENYNKLTQNHHSKNYVDMVSQLFMPNSTSEKV
jgi:hypothetical protein